MIQFRLVYNVKKKILQNGTALIQIRAYQNPKRRYISTGLYIKPSQWSKRLLKVIDHPNANEYNAELLRQVVELENYVFEWVRRYGSMTLDQLENFFKCRDSQSFTEFWVYDMSWSMTKSCRKRRKKSNERHLIIG